MARIDHYLEAHAPQANSIVVGVSVFVLDEGGRLLIIRRKDTNLCHLPGGVQRVGETVATAAIRETKAETGIDVEIAGLIGIYSDPEHVIEYGPGDVRQEFSICFRARPLGGEPRPAGESKAAEWVEESLLYELPIHPATRLRIQHGFDDRAEPYFS
ncbi:NUDIX domain-containing protein [Kibdelosporangium aridum]|uniref:NUDIX domain-containing protein n=1 Tax=Kibdelosporangium aridum TaxID=2030 RepID=A0A428ZG48_KIBAR|nr:NUDIX domain-containing protein [Kibdelosporangium aridum]RSM87035.1 NUDIX domain-containing protein [Kibdelosporangium aridum]